MSAGRRQGLGGWGWGLIVIAVCAVAARLVWWDRLARMWTDFGLPNSDARGLDMWAVNILDGIGFRDRVGFHLYEAFRMPFFSVVLAAIYAVFGYHYLPARIVLLLVSVATCLAVAGIGRLLFGRRVGFAAGLICAFYYPLARYAIAFMTETLFTFLYALAVYLFLRAVHERGWGFAVGSGLALGLAALTRFIAFAAIPVLLLYLVLQRRSRGRTIRLAAVWLAAACVSFAPWPLRNAVVLKAFFPTESGGTRQIWTGADPRHAAVTYSRAEWRKMIWADFHGSEMDHNRQIRRATRDRILEKPVWYLGRMLVRANMYLELTPWEDVVGQKGAGRWLDEFCILVAWAGYLGLALALLRRRRAGILLAGLFLVMVAIHSVAGENPRYRLTSEWQWVLGAAYLLGALASAGRQDLLAVDRARDSVAGDSIFDRRAWRIVVPVLLVLPFAVLAARIAVNRARLAGQSPPPVPASIGDTIRRCGLDGRLAEQGGLKDLAFYRELAARSKPEDVRYPADVTVFSGELLYFRIRADGCLDQCVFKINKGGLNPGDCRTVCDVPADVCLRVPAGAARLPAVVVGVISGSGVLGEPTFDAHDILVGGASLRQ